MRTTVLQRSAVRDVDGPCDVQVINGAAVVFAWFVMVETKKRSLSQIQAQLLRTS